MPFDGAGSTFLARSILKGALRAQMPAGFKWHFARTHYKTECGTAGCAVGLAYELGLARVPLSSAVSDAIGISRRAGRKIFLPFFTQQRYGVKRYDQITPSMVADALEKLPANA